jgi:hypothetical protein
MLRNIFRLLLLGLVVHAGVRVVPVFWNFYKLRDAVRETAMFPGRLTNEELVGHVVQLARTHDVALTARDIEVARDGPTTYIRTGYTKQLEYVPTRFYPWTFSIDVAEDPPRYGELIP